MISEIAENILLKGQAKKSPESSMVICPLIVKYSNGGCSGFEPDSLAA